MDLESYILAKEYVDEAVDFEIGKFLSLWDCTLGEPISFPETIPYTYTTGDYYIVSEVGKTNFKPTGTSYSGEQSSVEETGTVSVQDVFVYDGAVWLLLSQSDSKLGQKMDKINAKGIGSFSINGIAEGENSVAIGEGTVAGSQGQQVSGKYNVIDDDNTYLQIVGNGTNEDNRSNAYTLDQNGNAQFAGDVIGNKNGQEHKLSNKQDTLVSGTNIKTVNGESILGSGNLSTKGRWKLLGENVISEGTVRGIRTEITESSFFANSEYQKFKVAFSIKTASDYTNLSAPLRIYFQVGGTLGYRLYAKSSDALHRLSGDAVFYGELSILRHSHNANVVSTLLLPQQQDAAANAQSITGSGNNGVFEYGATAQSLNAIYLDCFNSVDFMPDTKISIYAWEEVTDTIGNPQEIEESLDKINDELEALL